MLFLTSTGSLIARMIGFALLLNLLTGPVLVGKVIKLPSIVLGTRGRHSGRAAGTEPRSVCGLGRAARMPTLARNV